MWQELRGSAIVVLMPAPLGRFIYVHVYLRKRLFFEPWTNLSRDDQFNTGEALAELLIFELDRVQTLLHRAQTGEGLWNEKVALPLEERASDGYSRLAQDVELLGPGSAIRCLSPGARRPDGRRDDREYWGIFDRS